MYARRVLAPCPEMFLAGGGKGTQQGVDFSTAYNTRNAKYYVVRTDTRHFFW